MTATPSFDDDPSLLSLIADGCHTAFAILVQRHSSRFYAVSYRILDHREDAEEVVQEAFFMLWHNPHLWDASRGTKFTTWFYRVVVNKSLDVRRRKAAIAGAKNVEELKDVLAADDDLESSLLDAERRSLVKNALAMLPERQRAAIILCFYEQVPQIEATKILGVSLKALEGLLVRAKASLRQKLSEDKDL